MLKQISKSDIITRPIKVYKEWTLDENDIFPIFGENSGATLVDIDTDEKSQGINKKVFYATIKSQFYRNASTASILTEVGNRKSYASTNERVLENELVVLPISQSQYGEGIKIGSVILEDTSKNRIYYDDGYSNLVDTTGSIWGNVFYDRGLVVVTRDVVSGSGILSDFTLKFRSTKTIYENEIFISVLENEFNVSQNPTAVYEDGGGRINQIINRPGNTKPNDLVSSSFYNVGTRYIRTASYPIQSKIDETKFGSFDDYEFSSSIDPTGSYLAPYITTIGLYDNEMNMVAIAKLPQPIKSMPDYPLNFIVRFDT
jgi:hypothetical protein